MKTNDVFIKKVISTIKNYEWYLADLALQAHLDRAQHVREPARGLVDGTYGETVRHTAGCAHRITLKHTPTKKEERIPSGGGGDCAPISTNIWCPGASDMSWRSLGEFL
jgi:hypothetical protein